MLANVDQNDGFESSLPPRFRLSRGDQVIAVILLFGMICLFLWPFVIFVVGPGEVGVLYRLLTTGTETRFVHPEGIGFKWPWNRVYFYSVRLQATDFGVHALARDGLTVDVDMTVLFHPVAARAGELHKQIGPEYAERLVRPLSIEAVRDVIGKIMPHDVYELDIHKLEQQVIDQLQGGPNELINYQRVTIRDVNLPGSLNKAITEKMTQQQYAAAYQYIIQREGQEAERKRIEAVGIQTFYSIVANALSPQLLTWRGIEATVELARTNNAKIVIVGSGKDQLPLILGSDIAKQPDLPTPSAINPEEYKLPDFGRLPKLFPNLSATPLPGFEDGVKSP